MNKLSVKYNLKYSKNEFSPITISVSWEGNRYMTSAGINIKSSAFDKRKARSKNGYENTFEVNKILDDIENYIKDLYFKKKSAGNEISKDDIRKSILRFSNPEKLTEEDSKGEIIQLDLITLFEKFIQERSNHPNYTAGTVRHYKVIFKNFKMYFDKMKIEPIYENINAEFVKNFIDFEATHLKYINSSIQKSLKTIKVFLNDIFEKGLINDENYKRYFKQVLAKYQLKTESTQFLLEKYEFDMLVNHIPETPTLDKIKDMFLVQIYTGLRYCDLKQINQNRINFKDMTLRINMQKTGKTVVIPIITNLFNILSKYDRYELNPMSNAKYNQYLKILCKNAGINQKVEIIKFSLKKRISKTVEKWEQISTHKGRGTFVVLGMRMKADREDIMKITGHSNYRSLLPYLKIAENESVNNIRNIWEQI